MTTRRLSPLPLLSLLGCAQPTVGPKESAPADDSGGHETAGQETGRPDSDSARESGSTGSTGDPHTGESGRRESGESGDVGESGESGDTGEVGPTFATPCTSFVDPVSLGTVADSDLDELSGIAVSRRDPDILWVHEDHAGLPAIYALDAAGVRVATVTLDGATNEDWEDIAVGPCGDDVCVYIGEIGNNDLDRTALGIYVLSEPDLSTAVDGEITVSDWDFYGFEYPDVNENAEGLAVTADGLPVVLTKRYEGEDSGVFIFPDLDPLLPVTLTQLGTVVTGPDGVGGAAALTAADLWYDDSRLLFRTYAALYEVDLSGGLGGITDATVTLTPGAAELHGEAAAYDPWRGGFWQVAEGLNPSIWYTGCAL